MKTTLLNLIELIPNLYALNLLAYTPGHCGLAHSCPQLITPANIQLILNYLAYTPGHCGLAHSCPQLPTPANTQLILNYLAYTPGH